MSRIFDFGRIAESTAKILTSQLAAAGSSDDPSPSNTELGQYPHSDPHIRDASPGDPQHLVTSPICRSENVKIALPSQLDKPCFFTAVQPDTPAPRDMSQRRRVSENVKNVSPASADKPSFLTCTSARPPALDTRCPGRFPAAVSLPPGPTHRGSLHTPRQSLRASGPAAVPC